MIPPVNRLGRRVLAVAAVAGVFLAVPAAGWAQPDETGTEAEGSSGEVVRLILEDEPITPATARYLERGIEDAGARGARAVIVELDTPGGLLESTRQIVRAIVRSSVPVVVYVAPAGARAASAGVFITMSAHVAAMAPGTHIGAAHPVSIGGGAPSLPGDTTDASDSSDPSSVTGEKVLNDAVAWVRSLAELRGRNAEWAARSVTESSSITATEAVRDSVVDLQASDLRDLLQRIDGRTVATRADSSQLRTAEAQIRAVPMWWGERVLGVVSNPNVAFLLMMFGFYGLLFEFYTGGWGVGGTVGAVCLLLASYGLSVLPVNYAGLALLILGAGLLVAEAFVVSYGALTVGGGLCVVFGGLMLVDTSVEMMRVSEWVVIPVALATSAIAFFLVGSIIRSHRAPVRTGSSGMIGERAVARTSFDSRGDRYEGTVRAHGELWKARAGKPVAEGAELTVVGRDGLTLEVVPDEREETAEPTMRDTPKS